MIRNAAVIACRHLDAGLDFRPHEYSTMAWSLVLTQAREECLLNRIASHVIRRAEEFGPQELTNTAWAFACLGVHTEGVFEVLGKECLVKICQFNNQNLTNVAWAYTHLNVGNKSLGLLPAIAERAHSRIPSMNVQDLAQMALTLSSLRRSGEGMRQDAPSEEIAVLGTREQTLELVKDTTIAMVQKLRQPGATFPDDAWMVHDLCLVWFTEENAAKHLGSSWHVLDSYVGTLYQQVHGFFKYTPFLATAKPCGSIVHSSQVPVYEQAFRELDLRSLGIKYTQCLLEAVGLADHAGAVGPRGLSASACAQLAEARNGLLRQDPGAGSQSWCLFRYNLQSETRVAAELDGIQIRSCGGDPAALDLLDQPREAHLVAVRLSNDRLNHRRRDAEFRALAHTAGVLRTLIPEVDALMMQRVSWGERLNGWVHLYVTEVPCLSCVGAMIQFSRRFPNVCLRVSFPGSSVT